MGSKNRFLRGIFERILVNAIAEYLQYKIEFVNKYYSQEQ